MELALDKNSSKILFSIAMEAENRRMFADADRIFSKAKAYGQKAQWNDTAEYACFLVRYADICIDTDRFARAEELFKEAVQIFCKLYGKDNLNTALAMRGLAEVMSKQGKQLDADDLLACARSSLSQYKANAS